METQIEFEGFPQKSPEVAQQTIRSIWLRAILGAFVCFSVFIIINGSLLPCFEKNSYSAINTQREALLTSVVITVVASCFPIAVVYSIMAGIILTLSRRLLARLTVAVLFVFLTGILNLCQIIVYR